MQQNKGISVVIPNYNGAALLPQIIPPLLLALNNSKLQYQIIVSDDFSTDNSIKFLSQNYPEIIILKNELNVGFSKTINKGIFIAEFDYVLLLNSDVKLSPNYFDGIFSYFNNDDTFGVMGRIIGWDNDVIQDGAKYPSFHGVKIKTNQNYIPTEPKQNDLLYSMYLSGANALVSKEKLLQLKGFDEIFSPFYVEDFELCLRAWRLGWKCYYHHNSICMHQTSTSIKSKSKKQFVKTIYSRNKMIMHAIHLSTPKLCIWYLQQFIEILIHIFTGRFYFLKSFWGFLKLQNQISLSKKRLKDISTSGKGLLSLNVVVNTIKSTLKNREIIRFK